MRSAIARLHSLVLQRSFQQQQQATQISGSLPHLSDLQQLASVALHGNNSSSSSCCCCCWGSPQAACASVRHMAGRTHKLSLKKANNRASWMAVAPFLQQQEQQPGSDQMQQRQSQVIQSAIPPLPVLKEPILYQKIGTITGPYSVGAQPCFAVMESGGTQWKVTADDVIYHNKIPGAHVNDVLEFNKVLLLGTQDDTTIGRPFVPGASVIAAVEETFKDAKVHVFKKKARKRYSKLQGHRSHITALRILEVRQPAAEQAAAAVSNVAAIGAGANQALDISSTKLTPHQLKVKRRSSRPAVSAAVQQLGRQDTEAAAEPELQQQQQQQQMRQPRRLAGAGRGHGPPAVLNAMGFVDTSGSTEQQASQ